MIKNLLQRLPRKQSKSDNSSSGGDVGGGGGGGGNASLNGSGRNATGNYRGAGVSSATAGPRSAVPFNVTVQNINSNNSGATAGETNAWSPVGKKLSADVVSSNGSLNFFIVEPLPSFRDVSSSERQSLLIKKLRLCSFVLTSLILQKMQKRKILKGRHFLSLWNLSAL